MERNSATTAIATAVIGSTRYKKYRVRYINPDQTCPACDIGNHILYIPKFAPIVNRHDDEIVRGLTAHECAHARYTPEARFADFQRFSPAKRNLVNAMEDERIERAVSSAWDVLGESLATLNNSAIGRVNGNFRSNPPKSPVDEAIMALHIKSMGYAVEWDLSDAAKMLVDCAKGIYDKSRALGGTDKDYDKLVGLADKIVAEWVKRMPPQPQGQGGQGQDDGQGDQSSDSQGQPNGQGAGQDDKSSGQSNGQGKPSGQSNGQSKPNGQGEGQGDQSSDSQGDQSNGQGAGQDDQSGQDGQCAVERDGLESSGIDYKREALDAEIKRIAQEQQKSELAEFFPDTSADRVVTMESNAENFSRIAYLSNRIMGRLSSELQDALLTVTRCRKRHHREDGWLDDQSIVELCKGLSPNVFQDEIKGESLKETCVTLLIDESGSMMSQKLYSALALANAFAEAMEYVGVRFEIVGHSFKPSQGKKFYEAQSNGFTRVGCLESRIYKTFAEDFESVRERLGASLAPTTRHECTADPDALLFAGLRNLAERAERHVVLVLSDGEPCYGNSGNAGDFLKGVIGTLRGEGCEIKAVGVMSRAPRRYYGEDSTVVVDNLNDLGEEFFAMVREVLIQAD